MITFLTKHLFNSIHIKLKERRIVSFIFPLLNMEIKIKRRETQILNMCRVGSENMWTDNKIVTEIA